MTAAETVGQVFLGVRLQCARCHNHPFDVWTQDDYYGLAAYFGNVHHKEVNNVTRKDNLDKHEINGDEMIYLSGQPEMVQPRTGMMMAPKPPPAQAPCSAATSTPATSWRSGSPQQPPVCPEHGQSHLVPPDRPRHRRSRR